MILASSSRKFTDDVFIGWNHFYFLEFLSISFPGSLWCRVWLAGQW